MPTVQPRISARTALSTLRRLTVLALAALPLLVGVGCKSMPPEGPGEWWVGKATVSGDAAMFGGGGDTCIMWQLPQGTTNWIWRVSTGAVTREWAVERRYRDASDHPDQGEVWWMGDSTGSWSGTIRPTITGNMSILQYGDHSGPNPPFHTFLIEGVPSSGDGRIEGKGEKVRDEVSVTLQWIKADGSVGATWKYGGLGQNEQEYLKALGRMGATPPAVVEPYPQRSP